MEITPIDVHVTTQPSGWDYVVGVSTILASVLALIAIWFAVKAGRDLVHDRRQAFELGILLALYEQTQALSSIPVDRTMQARVRLVPPAELPSLHELVLDPKPPKLDGTDGGGADISARSEYDAMMRKRAMREIEQAIDKRTH